MDMENVNNPSVQMPNNHPEATFSGAYQVGWETLKKLFPELLVVLLVQTLVSLPVGFANTMLFPGLPDEMFSNLFNAVYGLLVIAPVSYGCAWVYLKAVRGEPFRVYDIFFVFQQIGQVILACILVWLIVVAGLILLIVPGIIFACKLVFVPYLIMDKKLSATDAIHKSWEMTRGYGWTIFGMAVVSIFIILLGVICLIVGVFPAILWISLAFAGLYHAVSEKVKPGAEGV
jgi:uncharacterized membrane protein